jgi:maltose alpha-D-glucosyltransferase/alpha-amylase
VSTQRQPSASFYAVDVAQFQDSNGDGIGDLPGVIQRLDYIADLGFSWVWVLPFFPSPRRDNGYDITDYYRVDENFGTLDDFRNLVTQAHDRGLHVIIDLVAHHTSDQHPWFQAARMDPNSPFRDYYVWSPIELTENQPEPIFPGPETSVWTWDATAGEYFFHRFYRFQPDLNFANPRVQDEMIDVARYWMGFGIDGFRIDAANHLFEEKGIPGTAVADPCTFMQRLRAVAEDANPDAVLVAEADVDAEAIAQLACDSNGGTMFLNFLLNNRLFLGLARGKATAVAEGIRSVTALPSGCQWVNFLRNLDEIDLERLKVGERMEVFERFAPDADMRIYGRGIRRRLAPTLDGDQSRIRMLFSLLFSLPDPPLVVYGDEIGMGDDLTLPERKSVHLPMQWSSGHLGGFSTADVEKVDPAPVAGGDFGYEKVNVAKQLVDRSSLQGLVRELLKCRSDASAVWPGDMTFDTCADGRVLRSTYSGQGCSLVTLHNFSNRVAAGTQHGLPGEIHSGIRDEDTSIGADGSVTLGAYGFCWLFRP